MAVSGQLRWIAEGLSSSHMTHVSSSSYDKLRWIAEGLSSSHMTHVSSSSYDKLRWIAEGLSYDDLPLPHRNPAPSLQKSDTCANPVQKFRNAAPFLEGKALRGDFLDSYKSVPSGNLAWSRPVQISTSKIAS
jgi:hypothetical protein